MARTRSLFALSCLLFLSQNYLQAFRGLSTFIPRSQGVDGARDILSWIQYIQDEEGAGISGLLMLRPKYAHSFQANTITNYFMNNPTLAFSGSRVANRGSDDILADYFGLPSDYQSNVTLCPSISTTQFDISLYTKLWSCEYESWFQELYFFTQLPIVHATWNLNLQENVINAGSNFQPAGYMGKGDKRILRSQLVTDVKTSLQGTTTFGDMLEPLRYGKVNGALCCTDVADLTLELAWHIASYTQKHFELSAFLTIPTGTRPTGSFLFEPQIGNGHHWELGATASFYLPLRREREDNCSSFGIALYGRVGHLFASCQKRSFDLTPNGRGSRYMLLETIGTAVDDIVQIPAGSPLTQQYLGLLVPAVNVTTLDCSIKIGVQGEFAAVFVYENSCWQLDVGYNAWGRSNEILTSRQQFPSDRFGVKGDASLYGFVIGVPYYLGLNATQSMATLHAGQGTGNTNFANLNADNAAPAGGGLQQLVPADAAALNIPITAAGGSNPPILLTDANIDVLSALSPSALSNKLFVQGLLAFGENVCLQGHIGLGGELEFTTRTNKFFADTNNIAGGASQWGIWLWFDISY